MEVFFKFLDVFSKNWYLEKLDVGELCYEFI